MHRVAPVCLVVAFGVLVGCVADRQAATPSPSTPQSTVPSSAPPPPPKTPEEIARDTAKENLKQIGLAMTYHNDAVGALPVGLYAKGGEVGLSWRVQILPYLEQENLYRQFKWEEPWDSENNKKLIDQMPAVFASPGKKAEKGMTHLRSFVGPSAFVSNKPPKGVHPGWVMMRKRATILDDPFATLVVAEAAEPVIWTKPDELPFDGGPANPKAPLPKLGGVFEDGFHGLMGDGLVLFFPKGATTDDLTRAVITIDGKEPVDLRAIRKANGLSEERPAPPPRTPATMPTPAPRTVYTGPMK